MTLVPEQTGFAEGEIEILMGFSGLTTIVTAFEVAGFPLAQSAFEVSLQVITSPFTGIYE